MTARKTKTRTEPQQILVAELDAGGRLKLTSVIDAVNAARRAGEATIDMEGVSIDEFSARKNLYAVIESVKAIVRLHGLEFENTEPVELTPTDSKVSWIAKGTIRLSRRPKA